NDGFRSELEDLSDIRISLKERNGFPARNPRDSGVRVYLGQRRQQGSRPEHVAHRVELYDQHALFDLLVAIARAQHAVLFVPDAWRFQEKDFEVKCMLTRPRHWCHLGHSWKRMTQ